MQICLPEGATAPAATTPTTTTAPPPGTTIVPLAAFPVQGPCGFIDTWGAVRSGGRSHEGVDVIAKAGLYVYAVADGTLTKQAYDKPGALSGNAWWLTQADGTYFFYGHMSAFAPDLAVGSKVVAGQVIGFIGMTGNAATPHLHFEIHPRGGSAVNPTPSVKAVDGCTTTTPLPQPGGAAPPGQVATPATTAPATGGTTPATSPVPPPTNGVVSTQPGTMWQFISPTTAYDSSWTGSRVPGGLKKQWVPVDRLTGVPATTPGVMVRIMTKNAAGSGFLVVHPCDTSAGGAVTLSFSQTTAVGTAIVEVIDGDICISANVAVGVKLEVIAYRAAAGVGLQSVSSIRALDTRTTKRLGPGVSATISNTALGVTQGAQALSATITVVSPSRSGTLSIGFCGSGPWNVPFGSDGIASFSIAMRTSPSGWCVTSNVGVDLVVDVTGIWAPGASPSPLDPARVFDSRTAGVQVGPQPVAVAIAGQGGVPWDATNAMLAFSAVSGSSAGIVFAVPCDRGRSDGVVTASNPWRIITAVVPVKLSNGTVCLSALFPVDVIVDVVAAG
jgi:hypothetical protein